MPYLNQKGSMLVGAIIAITIIGVLAAGAVYLKSTSALGEVFENNQARANYLAESGGRYGTGILKLYGNSPEKTSYTYSMDSGKSKIVLYVYTTGFSNSTSYAKFSSTGIVNEGTWSEGRKTLGPFVNISSISTFGGYSSSTGTPTKKCMCQCGMM